MRPVTVAVADEGRAAAAVEVPGVDDLGRAEDRRPVGEVEVVEIRVERVVARVEDGDPDALAQDALGPQGVRPDISGRAPGLVGERFVGQRTTTSIVRRR
jgi:hypothetical protein